MSARRCGWRRTPPTRCCTAVCRTGQGWAPVALPSRCPAAQPRMRYICTALLARARLCARRRTQVSWVHCGHRRYGQCNRRHALCRVSFHVPAALRPAAPLPQLLVLSPARAVAAVATPRRAVGHGHAQRGGVCGVGYKPRLQRGGKQAKIARTTSCSVTAHCSVAARICVRSSEAHAWGSAAVVLRNH